MRPTVTATAARQSLADHAIARGTEIFVRYGPRPGWDGLRRLLEDRTQVRYPCAIAFGTDQLEEGELAYPEPHGSRPEDGFTLHVHPHFRAHADDVVAIVLYQLVAVNYGAFATATDAEGFGAAALGLTRDEYYEQLCGLADRVAGNAPPAVAPGGCRSLAP